MIRQAVPADRADIVAIDRVARLEPGRVAFVERVLDFAVCLVAEEEDRVLAYGALEYTFYENGFISMLYVAEPARRRGIGRDLARALAERCTTAKLFTSTNRSNGPMRALLTSLGYVRSGIIHNLDPGDPELVYFLDRRERR